VGDSEYALLYIKKKKYYSGCPSTGVSASASAPASVLPIWALGNIKEQCILF